MNTNLQFMQMKNGSLNVKLNGIDLKIFNQNTVLLPRSLGYGLTIKELATIPYAIQITELVKRNGIINEIFKDHNPTIIDYYHDYDAAEVAVIIMGPSEHFNYKCQEAEYLTAMKEVVKKNPYLEILPEYLEDKEFDIDIYCELSNMGVGYSNIGPFEFLVSVPGPTFGDIALQLDSLSIDLEKKAINILKHNGII